jgi:hypothetical protein
MDRPGLTPPGWAREILLLGDGDSDRAMTEARMHCAAARFTAMGRAVRIAWADEGQDFNDMVQQGARRIPAPAAEDGGGA